jgi:hypothetical protein
LHCTQLNLLALLVLIAGSGAQCTQTTWQDMPEFAPAEPRVLVASPSKEQLIDAVNANSGRVHAYWTNSASISMAGFSTLAGSIAVQQPQRLRLRAGSRLMGPEIDLGSNEELFWLWMRASQPPALFFCRHEQYGTSEATRVIPVPPAWLIESLGLVRFDPHAAHAGPYQRADGSLALHSPLTTPAGQLLKLTVVDATQGWVREQHVLSPQGATLASAWARGHRRDPATGIALPTRVMIRMPPTQLAIQIDVGDFVINQPVGDARQMWIKPAYPGYPDVDLAQLQVPLLPPAAIQEGLNDAAPPMSQRWKTLFRRPRY